MTIRELDRLVSKTEMTSISKTGLKAVRKAILSGRCGDPEVGTGTWSISMTSIGGSPVKMNFSFKRDTNERKR